jgi:hypothetical protein
VAHLFGRLLKPEALVQVQGLGRLDSELIWADENAVISAADLDQAKALMWLTILRKLT